MKCTGLIFGAALVAVVAGVAPAPTPGVIQFVFTADAHYGLTRPAFRGATGVSARTVNRALVAAINDLPGAAFPRDGGIGSAARIGAIDFLVEGGDVANRAEIDLGIQRAAVSWQQFTEDYGAINLTAHDGRRAPLFVIPGNHEASNAVGFYKPMAELHDPSALIGIFNLMVRPPQPRTPATFDYSRDRVLTSRDIGGLHLAFLHIWPDSRGRAWLDADLGHVPESTPVFVFTHDQPDVEAKHLLNPNAAHDVNARDRFENLLSDPLQGGTTVAAGTEPEQWALEQFVAAHSNITAYFHGNSNWNQFYDWTGPRHTIALHTFRVDSPMKGSASGSDETRLSFQVGSYDPVSRTLTVRECLWNANPQDPSLTWGGSVTVAVAPRSGPVTATTTVGGD